MMRPIRPIVRESNLLAFLSIVIAVAAANWATTSIAQNQEESSVLADSQVKAQSEAPVLQPPANQPTLPPPDRPAEFVERERPTTAAAKRPFMRPAQPKTPQHGQADLTSSAEPIPVPRDRSGGIEIRPTPPIKYDTDSDARRMYRHTGEIDLVMITQNPADGCFYEIPLCIPGCCVGEPTMSGERGIFGRGVVEYCWPSCGFRAIVKFRHYRGDVRVDYEGD